MRLRSGCSPATPARRWPALPLCGGGIRSSARHVFQVDAGGKAFGDLIFQFQHDPLGQLGADTGRGLEALWVARRDGQRHTVGFHDAQDGKAHFRAHARHRGEQFETGLLLLAGKAVELTSFSVTFITV